MSEHGGTARTSGPRSRERSHVGDAAETVLTALQDERCRRILSEIETQALSADELTEQLQLPMSTTYRKIGQLTDASLVAERTRVQSSGHHRNEYVRIVDDVDVSVAGDGRIKVTVWVREPLPTVSSD